MESWLVRARKAAGVTVEECARHLCLSANAYLEYERTPGMLNLNQIFALETLFNSEGNRILWAALADLKPSDI